jgi:hypothetical protein
MVAELKVEVAILQIHLQFMLEVEFANVFKAGLVVLA